jgi:RNA polymerase sigma factor (sigma-70 family)
MMEKDWLAQQFEEQRGHLRGVAYRMLGSLSEAEDAVQEAWLRLSRSDADSIDNLGGWLTTVVARVSLDMLRSRKSRREDALDDQVSEPVADNKGRVDPEQEALLADSVGLALLVVLDRLNPAERLAFVLHDLFDLSFEEIANVVGRTPAAARQLASRARRQVRGSASLPEADLAQQREVVATFLTALRVGDFEGLVAVLDPDLVVRIDKSALPSGAPSEVRGARNWAGQAIAFSRSIPFIQFIQPALVDGAVGIVLAPQGRLFRALRFTIREKKIAEIRVFADPENLRGLDLAVLENPLHG